MRIGIIGATGKVGRTFLEVLEKRNFPINNLYLYASKKSAGLKLNFKNKEKNVEKTVEKSKMRKNWKSFHVESKKGQKFSTK